MNNNSNVYHGGAAKAPGYAMAASGGGAPVSSEFYASLIHCNSEEIDISVNIPAPSDGSWNDARQGWYFGLDYKMKEAHFLFNQFRTNSSVQSISINLRRRLADGSGGAWISIHTQVTVFPNSGGGYDDFFGDHVAGLDLLIPAGYYVYAYCTLRTALDVEGVSIWIQYQKEPT